VAAYMLGRVDRSDWSVAIASPTPQVTSMNGLTVTAQMTLDELPDADAVIVGSGRRTREYAADPQFLSTLRLDPTRQIIGSQCSGALLLSKLGLLEGVPVCTDLITKPWVIEAGANVVDQPFFASGNVATAGGCLSSQYLAAWPSLVLPISTRRARHSSTWLLLAKRTSTSSGSSRSCAPTSTLRRVEPSYSSSSMLRGQLALSRRDSARSASSLPPVWHFAQ